MHTGHHTWKTAEGKDIHFQITTVPLESENGKPEFVMEMAVDITKTRQLEKEKLEAIVFALWGLLPEKDKPILSDKDKELLAK